MSEHHDETAETTAITESPAPAPAPAGIGWKDRVYGVRSVAAVAVAGLIIGGGAGAAIHAATADEGRDGPGRMGFQRGGPGGFNGPGQMQGQKPGQMPGQMPGQGQGMGPGGGQLPAPPNGLPVPPNGLPGQTPPSVAPDDSVNPDGGDATSGNNNT